MECIEKYGDLIRLIPVKKQSTTIRRDVWKKRFSSIDETLDEIFGSEKVVEISREEVLSEQKLEKKIVMVLMWGYPTGGRGNNIESILKQINDLKELLTCIEGKNLQVDRAKEIMAEFAKITGLGISTWSKLLYFFEVSFDSLKCQIYDQKIVDSLNKKQFEEIDGHQFRELETKQWKQDSKYYFEYIKLVDDLAKGLNCESPDQIELFLFYYNLDYKFI